MIGRFLGGVVLLTVLAAVWYVGLQGVLDRSAVVAVGCWTVVLLGMFFVGVVRNK